MHLDLELAAGRLLHVFDELAHVARMEFSVGVGRRHVPFGLRGRESAHRERSGSDEGSLHCILLIRVGGILA